jgi:hypothetical protein
VQININIFQGKEGLNIIADNGNIDLAGAKVVIKLAENTVENTNKSIHIKEESTGFDVY